jgi:hypothetical protein
METNGAGYYHWPAVWVKEPPASSGARLEVSQLGDEVFHTRLPVGIELSVSRDGLFAFDFSDWPPGCALPPAHGPNFEALAQLILRRVAVLNTHLACLYAAAAHAECGIPRVMLVSPSDLISFKKLNDPASGKAFGDERVAALVQARYPSTYAYKDATAADRRVNRFVVLKIEAVEESCDLLNTILEHPGDHTLDLTNLYAHGCKAFVDHDYSLCLTIAWTISEKLLGEQWDRYLERNRQRDVDGQLVAFINAERKGKLTGRDYTASVVSEILSLLGELPFETFKQLSVVRGARNNWLHDLKPVSMHDAILAVRVSEQMLQLVEGIQLQAPLSLHIHTAG